MNTKDVNLGGQIQDLLKAINMKVRHVMIKEFDNRELTIHQIYIMKVIKKNPDINLTSLGNCLNLAKSSISLTINKLVEEGYVLRKEDPNDRRNKYIVLSEEGERVMNESKDMSKKIFNNLLSGLTHEDLEEIKNNLIKIDNAIEKNIED